MGQALQVVGEEEIEQPKSASPPPNFDTSLSPDEEKSFQTWKTRYAPKDSGEDYDLRGAFKSGLTPDPKTGHWPDTFKKPNHPTFSVESQYAKYAPEKAGHWNGDQYVKPDQAASPSSGLHVVGEEDVTPPPTGLNHRRGSAPAPTSAWEVARRSLPKPPQPEYDYSGGNLPEPKTTSVTSEFGPTVSTPNVDTPEATAEANRKNAADERARVETGTTLSGVRGYPKIYQGAKKLIHSHALEGGSESGFVPTDYTPEVNPREAASGLADVLRGTGEAATPLALASGAAAPVRTAISLGTGLAASEGAGALAHGRVAPEYEDAIRQLAFWVPGLAAHVLGPRVGVGITPEEVNVRAGINPPGVGPKTAEFSFSRGPKPGPTVPDAGTIAPPTIEGEFAKPTPTEQALAEQQIIQHRAGNVASGKPAYTPPPPPPGPEPPPDVAQGNITPETIQKVGKAIASLPPNLRAQAMLETHGTLSQQLVKQGKVVLPDGKLAVIDSPKSADKIATDLINAEVERQDGLSKATRSANEKPAAVTSKNTPAAAAGELTPRVTRRQKAAELNKQPLRVVGVESVDADEGNVSGSVPQIASAGNGATNGNENSGSIEGQHGSGIESAAVAAEQHAPEQPSLGGRIHGNNESGNPEPLTVVGEEEAGVEPNGQKSEPAVQPDSVGGLASNSEKPAAAEPPTFKKGDKVTLADGRSGTIEFLHPTMSIVRGHTENGERFSIGKSKLKPAEKPTTKYKYGNTQADIPHESEASKAIESARQRISDGDLAGKGKDVGGNHVTVRYGIKGDDIEGIKKYLSQQKPFEASLGKTEKFEPTEQSEGAAVIKAPIESEHLQRMNSELEQHGEFIPPTFKEYKPHATVAYVKPEAADRYVGMDATHGKKFTVDSVTISKKDGSQETVKLEGKDQHASSTGRSGIERRSESTPSAHENRTVEDRRTNEAFGKRVEDMTPEERAHVLLTDDKTGLGNERAFKEAEAGQPAKVQGYSDLDGLGAINDKFGHEAGNALIEAKGAALRKAGVDAYRLHGDEFAHRGEDDLPAKLDAARELLRNRHFRFVDAKTGKAYDVSGADFSYGTGKGQAEADRNLLEHKTRRRASGERAEKGKLGGSIQAVPERSASELETRGTSEVSEPINPSRELSEGVDRKNPAEPSGSSAGSGTEKDRAGKSETKEVTPTKEDLITGESGTFEPGKIGEAVKEFYKQDVGSVLDKAGIGMKDTAGLFVRAFYPRIAESNAIGRLLNVAAPTDAVDALMKLKGDREHAMASFDLLTKGMEKMFDRLPESERVDFIDRLQSGEKQPTPELESIADFVRDVQAKQRAQEQEAANLGRPADKQVKLSEKQNYFHNRWEKKPSNAPEAFEEKDEDQRIQKMFSPRRPLEGTRSYNKQQSYTLKSGIESGGKPVTTNPIRILRSRLEDGMKFVTARQAWQAMDDLDLRTFVKTGQRPPEGFDKIDDRIAKVYFPAESGEGSIQAGEWYVEANTARLLNNMLSRDLIRGNAAGRGLLWLKNASTALELGLSPFHAVFETIEAASSQMALGQLKIYNQGIRQGDAGAFLSGLKDILTSPIAPATMAREGSALPAYIEARAKLESAKGGQFAHHIDGEDQPHGIMEAMKQFHELRKEAGIQRLLKQYPDLDQLVDDMFSGGMNIGQHKDYQTKILGKTAAEAWTEGNPIGAVMRAIPTANQAIMYPLFQWYIPNLKYGLFLKQMSQQAAEHAAELESGTMTRGELARRVVDSVENRFGELNFDNLFWNRTLKTALQFAFRSVTWKMGNVREISSGLGGQSRDFAEWAADAYHRMGGEKAEGKTTGEKVLPRLDMRASWLMSLAVTTALLGIVASKILAGKYPWDLEGSLYNNILHPQTGDTDTHGKPVRISLPTYAKDVEHAIKSPRDYVTGSFSTTLSKAIDLSKNEDYFENYVYNPKAPIGTKLRQAGKYAFPAPFSVSNFQRSKQQGETKTAWLSAFGFPRAPSDLDFTPAEKLAKEILKANKAPATPEQLEEWSAKRQAYEKGELSRSEAKQFIRRERESLLQRQVKDGHMGYADAVSVYNAASPEEKNSLGPIMRAKRERLLREHRAKEIQASPLER